MSAPQLTLVARIILAVGAVAAVAWIAHLGGDVSVFDRITAWALVPYALFFAASAFARDRGRAISLLTVCAVSTGCALLIYGATLLVSIGFTNGLVLLFLPLFQTIASAILLMVLFFSRRAPNPKASGT